MTVKVEVAEETYRVARSDLTPIKHRVDRALRNALNLSVDVELVEPGSIPRSEGKAKRVVDNRKL
jgi:phenylacetate-CoA ligase